MRENSLLLSASSLSTNLFSSASTAPIANSSSRLQEVDMPSGQPWLPPYLGSWEDLISGLRHDPFLGSGDGPPRPLSVMLGARPSAMEPNPSPWRHVVEGFVAAVNVMDLASRVSDEVVRKEMEQSAGQSIVQLLEDYCGTPPRLWPWPWPGPPPWVFGIASDPTLTP
jgi:hypothetical protein